MEKARLTQEQADALTSMLTKGNEDQIIKWYVGPSYPKSLDWGIISEMPIELLSRALYLGYEIIQGPQTIFVEEQMKSKLLKTWEREVTGNYDAGKNAGIRFTLQTLGVRVIGITDREDEL